MKGGLSYLLVPVGVVGGGWQRVAVGFFEGARERSANLRKGGWAVGGHVQDGMPSATEILRPLDDQRIRPWALQDDRGGVRKQCLVN